MAALVVICAVLSAVVLGWAAYAFAGLAVLLVAALAWFIFRAVSRRQPGKPATAVAVYRVMLTLLAGWVLVGAARSGMSAADHPAHQLGVIIVDLGAAVALVIAASGWLLAAFAVPEDSKSVRVPALVAVGQAAVAAGMAVSLYAIS
ncbi:hypothetical protein KIH31_04975 [Paenarthrobacter sp. DKR-5]|uniref:hypothetical protein n=1 Tax=Paenarthrobacter sp. DKR-5 TaxID=2835535 RepID=UPI001BDBC3DB|nr:hypothetical protein [Paenarthrobacter sp. DKR-5]MBT1001951.1 hypothetical protein [Paenarthrobacter sp. DKR-5]